MVVSAPGSYAQSVIKRVAVLYGVGELFLCRTCYLLPYASLGEDSLDRLRREADKISDRLVMDEEDEG
jgi:hypothetical protein